MNDKLKGKLLVHYSNVRKMEDCISEWIQKESTIDNNELKQIFYSICECITTSNIVMQEQLPEINIIYDLRKKLLIETMKKYIHVAYDKSKCSEDDIGVFGYDECADEIMKIVTI